MMGDESVRETVNGKGPDLSAGAKKVIQMRVSEQAAKETLAIPIYPELTEEMQARMVEVISAFYCQ